MREAPVRYLLVLFLCCFSFLFLSEHDRAIVINMGDICSNVSLLKVPISTYNINSHVDNIIKVLRISWQDFKAFLISQGCQVFQALQTFQAFQAVQDFHTHIHTHIHTHTHKHSL